MFFGTLNPQVAFVEGNTKLDDFIRSRSLDYPNDDNAIVSNQSSEACSDIIPEGQRNSTLYQYACKILVRFGENDNSHDNFLKEAQLCSPPLPQNELNTIWSNAVKFYNGQILNRNDYIPPNLYGCYSLKPSDFTDIGQANVFVCKYGEIIKYSPATDFLVFNGSFWEEDNQHARALAQELTEKQLNEAETKIKMAEREILRMQKSSFPGDTQNERQLKALKEEYADAIFFKDYALKRRNSQRISATLTEVAPKITVKPEILDADPYLLNTPSATYDLRYGLLLSHEHLHNDFITKQTAVDPSDNGMDIWLSFLNTIFVHDEHLINYVQQITGLGAIGLVFEAMIIAFGKGNNGKSTLWNSIKKVLGTYSGIISADILTTTCRRNIKPELAELRGKRLIIASELDEGASLSTSVMKQLASTDTIKAEKNFKKLVMTVNTNDALVAKFNTVNTGTLNVDNLAKTKGTIVWEGDAKEVVMSIKGAEEGKWGNTQFHSIIVSFDGSTPTPQPVVIEEINVAKALEIIGGLADGAKTDKEYKVKGFIVGDPDFQRKTPAEGQEVGELFGNVNLYLADTKGGTNTLYVYRAKDFGNKNFTEETITLKADDEVMFQGLLQKYVKDDVVTPELVSGYLTTSTAGIENVAVKAAQNGRIYNLAGQEVSKNFKGIVVKNGKKYMNK